MKNGTPKVSIGLPVFNGEQYLREALDSLLAQTFEDFELIISDNASTDGTAEIGREYARKDRRVRYYRNEANIGADPNFVRAFELSRGQYFKWAAHDDLYAPSYLARCAETLDADLSLALCHSRSVLIDSDGNRIAEQHVRRGWYVEKYGNVVPLRTRHDHPTKLDARKPHVRFRDVLLRMAYCFEIFGLMRSELVRKTSLPGGFLGSDKVFLAEIALRGRFAEVPEELFFRRCHVRQGSSLSPRARDAFADTRAATRTVMPQVLCLRGYARSLRRVHLTWAEQAGCVCALLRYLAQVSKWTHALDESLQRILPPRT